MSKYSLTYLMENDMDDMGSSTRLRITKDIVVIPKGDSTIQDLINALNNPNNYGIYLHHLNIKIGSLTPRIIYRF